MKYQVKRQNFVRKRFWKATLCALVLTVELAWSSARALPQPRLDQTEEIKIGISAEIPLKLYGDFVIVVQGSVGERHRLKFLIDTGSSSTVVDSSLVRQLRLAGSPKKIEVFGSTVTTEQVVLPSLQFGSLQVTLLPAVVRDLSYFQDSLSAHIDVIVGIDVLSRSSFTVDFETKKMILGPIVGLSNSVECDPRFPYPTVPIRIGDQTFWVFVDTGAQDLALFTNPTERVWPHYQIVGQETRTSMAGHVAIEKVILLQVSLGSTQWPRRNCIIMEAPSTLFDGLLGPRWLGVKRIGFDAEHKIIRWER